MDRKQKDGVVLATLALLVTWGALASRSLHVDVENLAMKSVGTEAARSDAVRSREFGDDPTLVVLASPLAPDLVDSVDQSDYRGWLELLTQEPSISSLEEKETSTPGEHCISVQLLADPDGRYAESVERFLAAAYETAPPTYALHVSGVPRIETAIAAGVRKERSRILPGIVLALAVVLILTYRNVVLAVGGLLAPLCGVVLLEGLQACFGLSVDPVSALLGPSILTVGVASSIHLLGHYRRSLRSGATVDEASRRARRDLTLPMALTVATTMGGFLGLLTSPIPAVQRFGMLASIGVATTMILAWMALPSFLRTFHRTPALAEPRQAASTHAVRHLGRVAVLKYPLALLALGGGALGALHLRDNRVDNSPLKILSSESQARIDAEAISDRIGGADTFELLLPPEGPDSLSAVLSLARHIEDLPGVVRLARSPRRSENGYSLLTFLMAPGGSDSREGLFLKAERIATREGWYLPRATGLAVRLARDSNDLVHRQRRGVLVTLLALGLIMSVGFRSISLGLIGLIPNVLPFLLLQGGMGLLGRPLSVASSMIGIVMLGLVVDDTIHFLHEYREARGSTSCRLLRALENASGPILLTTLVLVTGFAVTLTGELHATREFGTLAILTLLIALVADLCLLPALFLLKPSRTRRATKPSSHTLQHG